MGRSLYKGTWKSSTLAAKFFEVSPDLVRNLPFWDVEVFASLIEALSYKSYDVAAECLVLGRDVLPGMGREREPFLSMSRALIEGSWREVKSCLEMVPKALQQVEEGQTGRFLKLGERLAKVGLRDTSRFLADGTQALSRVPQGSQGYILDLCESLLAVSPEAVPAFLKSLSSVLDRITVSQLDAWFQHGVGTAAGQPGKRDCLFQDRVQHFRGHVGDPVFKPGTGQGEGDHRPLLPGAVRRGRRRDGHQGVGGQEHRLGG